MVGSSVRAASISTSKPSFPPTKVDFTRLKTGNICWAVVVHTFKKFYVNKKKFIWKFCDTNLRGTTRPHHAWVMGREQTQDEHTKRESQTVSGSTEEYKSDQKEGTRRKFPKDQVCQQKKKKKSFLRKDPMRMSAIDTHNSRGERLKMWSLLTPLFQSRSVGLQQTLQASFTRLPSPLPACSPLALPQNCSNLMRAEQLPTQKQIIMVQNPCSTSS